MSATSVVDSSKTVDSVFRNLENFLPRPISIIPSHLHGLLAGLIGALIVFRQYPAKLDLNGDELESEMEKMVRLVTRGVVTALVFILLQGLVYDVSFTLRNAFLNRNHLAWVRWFGSRWGLRAAAGYADDAAAGRVERDLSVGLSRRW